MTEIDWKQRADHWKAELDRGGFASADDYQQVKDLYWSALAKSKGMIHRQLNPMNFWFGGQSN